MMTTIQILSVFQQKKNLTIIWKDSKLNKTFQKQYSQLKLDEPHVNQDTVTDTYLSNNPGVTEDRIISGR